MYFQILCQIKEGATPLLLFSLIASHFKAVCCESSVSECVQRASVVRNQRIKNEEERRQEVEVHDDDELQQK